MMLNVSLQCEVCVYFPFLSRVNGSSLIIIIQCTFKFCKLNWAVARFNPLVYNICRTRMTKPTHLGNDMPGRAKEVQAKTQRNEGKQKGVNVCASSFISVQNLSFQNRYVVKGNHFLYS